MIHSLSTFSTLLYPPPFLRKHTPLLLVKPPTSIFFVWGGRGSRWQDRLGSSFPPCLFNSKPKTEGEKTPPPHTQNENGIYINLCTRGQVDPPPSLPHWRRGVVGAVSQGFAERTPFIIITITIYIYIYIYGESTWPAWYSLAWPYAVKSYSPLHHDLLISLAVYDPLSSNLFTQSDSLAFDICLIPSNSRFHSCNRPPITSSWSLKSFRACGQAPTSSVGRIFWCLRSASRWLVQNMVIQTWGGYLSRGVHK